MRAGQGPPTVRIPEPGEALPPFSRAFDPSNDLVSGWILTACDPALPEGAAPTRD
jgi:hypothetical protein